MRALTSALSKELDCTEGENTGSIVGGEFGCLKRRPVLMGWTIPGEQDDREVGVDVLLHIPGELEYLVEGLPVVGKLGVGGGKF